MTPTGGLEGISVLVTGGATGIGRACAERFVRDGAAVTICGRTEAKLEAATPEIEKAAQHGGTIRYVVGDLTQEADAERIVEEALKVTGKLNACVANAGGGGR